MSIHAPTDAPYGVIEFLTQGKNPDQTLCEDRLVVAPHFVAVVDGATDTSGLRFDGLTGGALAAEVCANVIATLDPDITAREAIDELSRHVAAIAPHLIPQGPSACVCIFSVARREVWRVGDSQFAVDGVPAMPVTRRIDDVAAGARSAFLHAQLASGATLDQLRANDPGRELILPLLRSQHVFRNQPGPFAFGAIDGQQVPDELVHVTPIPPTARELVLHTDGYPRTLPTLDEAEQTLAGLLAADPLCIDQLAGTKGLTEGLHSFDDRTYIRLRLPTV